MIDIKNISTHCTRSEFVGERSSGYDWACDFRD